MADHGQSLGDDDDGFDSDAEWETWADEEVAPTRALFSDHTHASAAECLAEASSVHGLDLPALVARLRLDIYGRVQLVNFVRGRFASGVAPAAICCFASVPSSQSYANVPGAARGACAARDGGASPRAAAASAVPPSHDT